MAGQVDLFSLVIPVYKNEASLDRLLGELTRLDQRLSHKLEVVFVVDGSPDRCYEILQTRLLHAPLRSQLLLLSRNFGSFAATTAGLAAARGDFFAVLAADLQEPPQLAEKFFTVLAENRADIVFGTRQSRSDSFASGLASNVFWLLYRRFVVHDIPRGGVDVFACNRLVRDRLLEFRESNTNLIALLFWLGFRRAYISYDRVARLEGKSAWTLKKKWQYCLNSIFNFTDLPVQLLLSLGSIALVLACIGCVMLIISRLIGHIRVPGYTAIVLAILFFGALTSLGLGILGQYLWLTLQNTRRRPNYIVFQTDEYKHEAESYPVETLTSDAK